MKYVETVQPGDEQSIEHYRTGSMQRFLLIEFIKKWAGMKHLESCIILKICDIVLNQAVHSINFYSNSLTAPLYVKYPAIKIKAITNVPGIEMMCPRKTLFSLYIL